MEEKEFSKVLRDIRKQVHEISNSIMVISGRAELTKSDDESAVEKLLNEIDVEVDKIAMFLNNIYEITETVINELEDE